MYFRADSQIFKSVFVFLKKLSPGESSLPKVPRRMVNWKHSTDALVTTKVLIFRVLQYVNWINVARTPNFSIIRSLPRYGPLYAKYTHTYKDDWEPALPFELSHKVEEAVV